MMTPDKIIDVQNWMRVDETQAVMAALNTEDEPMALFVGGCVRNTLLGKVVGDVDIATRWTPEETIRKLGDKGIRAVPTGIDHGTVTATFGKGKRSFEITSLRKDVETDGRRAVVAFTQDWREDAERRDFTMNTLLADDQGHVYDPLGAGLSDLEARRVVFVGSPADRIAEDYLRILRFFRFHAYYGVGDPDPAAVVACRVAAPHIQDLSRERVTQEFLKILAADNAADVFKILFNNKILNGVFDSKYEEKYLRRVIAMQIRFSVVDVITRLTVLSAMNIDFLTVLENKLVLSNLQKKRFRDVISAANLLCDLEEKSVKALMYKYKKDVGLQAVLCFAAGRDVNPAASVALINEWELPVFPLSGDDLISFGFKPGPEMGKALRATEEWWVEQDFKPGVEECLKYLKS